ncbi:hypothetical protein [Armatimonas rosea]|uniref:DUF58 domain-containing protein n=1 Tax=Armatimonas rosea TaxID=685828 RepID=A0A7W9W6X6_ARMRO|nr:hypothetical protein [Armatimonas rosea]MBB6051904.1 hypothetical protein [Armatimonas rosea]
MLLDPEFVQKLESALPSSENEARRAGRRTPRSESLFRLARRSEPTRKSTRLERLLIRLLRLENTTLHVLLDASVAMTFSGYTPPEPSPKFDFARRFTAALGYATALREQRFEVTALSPARGVRSPVLQQPEDIGMVLHYLEGLRAGGTRNFAWALRKRVRRTSRRSLFLLLSDFRDRNWEWGAPALLTGEARIVLIHLMDRSEMGEGGLGLRMEDDIRQRLAELAQRYQLEYLIVPTDTPLEEVFLHAAGER